MRLAFAFFTRNEVVASRQLAMAYRSTADRRGVSDLLAPSPAPLVALHSLCPSPPWSLGAVVPF